MKINARSDLIEHGFTQVRQINTDFLCDWVYITNVLTHCYAVSQNNISLKVVLKGENPLKSVAPV